MSTLVKFCFKIKSNDLEISKGILKCLAIPLPEPIGTIAILISFSFIWLRISFIVPSVLFPSTTINSTFFV